MHGEVIRVLLKYCIYCASAPSLHRESTDSLINCVLYYDPTVECYTQEYFIFAAIAICVLVLLVTFFSKPCCNSSIYIRISTVARCSTYGTDILHLLCVGKQSRYHSMPKRKTQQMGASKRRKSQAERDVEAETDTGSLPDRLVNPEDYEPVLLTGKHTAVESAQDKNLNKDPRRLTEVHTCGSI